MKQATSDPLGVALFNSKGEWVGRLFPNRDDGVFNVNNTDHAMYVELTGLKAHFDKDAWTTLTQKVN